ncbi:MAG: 2-oxoacid:acceptor oxidoreductase family protein [Elusimicrobia bacterium]|nr:2-oxoacid:acceptor oxidoreductase family protein [Elusimicrobiota bacterium]
MAARGGFAKSDILIGTDFIPYFEAQRPDIILVLSNEAYPEIKGYIAENTLVVLNSNEVTDYDRSLGKIYSFPFSEMAFELGSLQAVNMIALAFIIGKTGIVKKEALREAVKHKYPGEKEIPFNMKALQRGFKLAEE